MLKSAVVMLVGALVSVLMSAEEPYPEFKVVPYGVPYIGSDGSVVRSSEDNITAKNWPEEKQRAYERYTLATPLRKEDIPRGGPAAHALLKQLQAPIAISHCWVKYVPPAQPGVELRRIILWLEPRPKYVNLDEIQAAVKQGVFDNLFPPYPIKGFNAPPGHRLGAGTPAWYPWARVSTELSPGGRILDVMPVQCDVDYFANCDVPSVTLINAELDNVLIELGSGRTSWLEVVYTKSGVVIKNVGTQFGHIGYRWVSGGNVFALAIMDKDRDILEAFVQQQPSELPKDFTIAKETVAMQMLRRGLERLRQAPPVIEDDPKMIRIRATQNRDVFGRGLGLLHPLKDLWPITYGHQKAREERVRRHISSESEVFDWQAYINEETAARAKTLAAVDAFAIEAEKRGLVHQPKVQRIPWETYAGNALPPCWVLVPEK